MKPVKKNLSAMGIVAIVVAASMGIPVIGISCFIAYDQFELGGIVGLVAILVIAALIVVLLGKRVGAVRYAHAPYGVIPTDWQTHPVVAVGKLAPVVRDAPPSGARAYETVQVHGGFGEASVLAALWLELLTRGYMRVVRYTPEDIGFKAVPRDLSSLTRPEREFLTALFKNASFVHFSVFAMPHYQKIILCAQKVARETLLFRAPSSLFFQLVGLVIGVLSLPVSILAVNLADPPVSLFLTLVAIAMIMASVVMFLVEPVSAYGWAVREQVEGYRRYLETVRPEMLRWDEGVDVLSRDLAYAVAAGGGERWIGCLRLVCPPVCGAEAVLDRERARRRVGNTRRLRYCGSDCTHGHQTR